VNSISRQVTRARHEIHVLHTELFQEEREKACSCFLHLTTHFTVFQRSPRLYKAVAQFSAGRTNRVIEGYRLVDDYKFEWQRMLHEALVEQDPERLKERVAEAEAAVFLRLQDLAQAQDSPAERNALQDASNALLALKIDMLKFPHWKA
jgi:hypothetical protein